MEPGEKGDSKQQEAMSVGVPLRGLTPVVKHDLPPRAPAGDLEARVSNGVRAGLRALHRLYAIEAAAFSVVAIVKGKPDPVRFADALNTLRRAVEGEVQP